MDKYMGVYVHIPFCESKCGYCDFYSLADRRSLMPRYCEALCEHLAESASGLGKYLIDSVYFGGGTPSAFGPLRLTRVLNEIKMSGSLLKDAEISLEANPESVRLDHLKQLRKAGFNRISLGVQSMNYDILKMIGRRHDRHTVIKAVEAIREARFDNLSIDLMYGLPSQKKEDWADTLARVVALKPEHISCYGLTLHEGTRMYDEYSDSVILPTEDEQADMYMYAASYLKSNGYNRYEISNFCLKGYECRHNMKYWRQEDYVGFGPGAHSKADGLRYSYVKDVDAYIEGVLLETQLIDECEEITQAESASEYVILGMRTTEGISEREYKLRYKSSFEPARELLDIFVKNGWATCKDDDSWRFTSSGFLVSNSLIIALLDALAGNRVDINPWMREQYPEKEEAPLPPDEKSVFMQTALKRHYREM